jgi:hypothetical protein
VGGVDFEVTPQIKGKEGTEYCKLCYLEVMEKLDINARIKEVLDQARKDIKESNGGGE